MAAGRRLELPITQVHLDFHTPGEVRGIGADFDPDAFADTFARAGVGQVNLFARCHHGWCYYPTKVGRMHPGLRFDLLGAQMKALKSRGIRTAVYLTVGWDERTWRADPEMAALDRDGRAGTPPLTPGWHLLCLNTPAYLDHVAAYAREILQRYRAEGLFFDILMQPHPACFCPRCTDRMAGEGVDGRDDAQAAAFSHRIIREACARLARAARAVRKDVRLFFNSCLSLSARDLVAYDTHVEVESLPTGGWGYMHFAVMGPFARTLGKPFVGMTARFHRLWGDFGGLKTQAALEQESFHSLMLGGAVCVGDHLHPRGRLEPAVYDRIGNVFRQIQAREPWCRDAKPVAQVAVLTDARPGQGIGPALSGAVRILAERQFLFDVVDADADFTRYAVLVLPDEVRPDEKLAAKVARFLARGGKVLATARSGMAVGSDRFVLSGWPVAYAGEARHSQPYLVLGKDLAGVAPAMPHALYRPGPEVRAARGAKVLATLGDPYFSRTDRHFYGHGEAPMARSTRRPAIVCKGRIAYAQAPLFAAYAETAYPVYRDVVGALVDRLLGERALEVAMPTTGRATLLKQGRRLVVHLMHYVAERRAEGLDIIEDRLPLRDVALSVAMPARPQRVYLAPEGGDLDFCYHRGRAYATVPMVDGHRMVVLER